MGTDRANVHRLENAPGNPTVATLARYAEAIGKFASVFAVCRAPSGAFVRHRVGGPRFVEPRRRAEGRRPRERRRCSELTCRDENDLCLVPFFVAWRAHECLSWAA